MSSAEIQARPLETQSRPGVDMKLEVVVLPVADVDRSKRFYGGLGWRLDADFPAGDAFRSRAVHASRLAVLDPFRQGRAPRRPGRPGSSDNGFISSFPTS